MKLIFLLFSLFLSDFCFAQKSVEEKNYFASLRTAETNVRAGPGQSYPVKFSFKAKSIPVKVISEYDNWNEIEDYEGQVGWVSQNLLTKKRFLIIRTKKELVNMHIKNNEKSRIVFYLENNAIGEYIKCADDWCALKINDKKGWVKKIDTFGSDDL
jgi:SH3-like domain-containing protein